MANQVITVADVYSDVSRVLGTKDSATIYSRLNDIVEILSTESDWDPTRGYIDVNVGCDGTITMPDEVDVVLAVNVGGRPTEMHDFWFMFHLNGPGEFFGEQDYNWSWTWGNGQGPSQHTYDGLSVCVFNDPICTGVSVVCQLESAADNGTPVRVFGYDTNNQWIRSIENGLPVDGFLVPTIYGNPQINPNAPQIRTITRVSKQGTTTKGYIGLWAVTATGTYQMGNYAPTELEPKYRRIKLSRRCACARVAFKRRTKTLSQPTDLIFLHSRYAIITMAKSLKKLDDDRIQEAEMYQQKAVNFLIKKQKSVSVPSGPSIQIADNNLIADKRDWMV